MTQWWPPFSKYIKPKGFRAKDFNDSGFLVPSILWCFFKELRDSKMLYKKL